MDSNRSPPQTHSTARFCPLYWPWKGGPEKQVWYCCKLKSNIPAEPLCAAVQCTHTAVQPPKIETNGRLSFARPLTHPHNITLHRDDFCMGKIFAIGFFAGGYFSPYFHRKLVVKLFALWRQKVVEKVWLSSIWRKLNTFSQPHETVIFHTCNICAAPQFELLQGLWTLVWGKNLFSYSCRRWFGH